MKVNKEETAADLLYKLLQNPPPDVDLTIVGGSALVFWSQLYISAYPQFFHEDKVVGTQDIDFIGLSKDAEACHHHWGGNLIKPGFNHATPEVAILRLQDNGVDIEIDFLQDLVDLPRIKALKGRELVEGLPGNQGVYVLSEIMVLLNRVSNTLNLAKYQSDHGLDQIYNAISVVKAAIQARIDVHEYSQAARLAYNVLDLSRKRGLGIELFIKFKIDLLDALIYHDNYPEEFNSIALPALMKEITDRREAKKAHLERREREKRVAK